VIAQPLANCSTMLAPDFPGSLPEFMELHLDPLTYAQFHASVLALDPQIAVFDCDGTLWSGDAGSAFMRWSFESGLLSPDATAWLKGRYDGYKRGEVSELAICGEMVQVYSGMPVSRLREAAQEFFRDHVERNIFPEMLELVTELHRRGTEIWAVSSTCDWVIEEGVKQFKIHANRVLAASVFTENGIATGRLRDVPTDEGKVAALACVGITAAGRQPDCVFGNSIHDAAMLSIARAAFPVNPTPALVEAAAVAGWPLFYPSGAETRPAAKSVVLPLT
jgi:phosphoserine phosphatase